MSRWRITLVTGLISLPVLVWAGFGTYYLWTKGWGLYAWWPLMEAGPCAACRSDSRPWS